MRFSNKRVIVTGASRGIGLAIAEAFRSEGAWVIGTRTGAGDAESDVCQEWIQADFSELSQIEDCAAKIRESDANILVNNAGINKIAPFLEIKTIDFLKIHQVNVLAPLLLSQAAIPAMLKTGWGRIINISSIWGIKSREQRAAYTASKFAIDGLTVSLAAEFSQNGILANSIAPGFIDTELTHRILGADGIRKILERIPANRLGSSDEVARLAIFLSSEENSYITGQNLVIDGGFSRV